MIIVIILFAGCSVYRADEKPSNETMKSLGIAYKEGSYSLTDVYCTGYITSSQTIVNINIALGRRLLDGQKVNVTGIQNAQLRVNGKYIIEYGADLTKYILSAKSRNDGGILSIRLENPDKWRDSDKNFINNNILFSGILDITFNVVDP